MVADRQGEERPVFGFESRDGNLTCRITFASRGGVQGVQYTAIHAWDSWTLRGTLADRYDDSEDHIFADHRLYPSCEEKGLRGKNCFFRPASDDDTKDGDEAAALKYLVDTTTEEEKRGMGRDVERWLGTYRNESRTSAAPGLPALDHLLVFAHLARCTST